MHNFAQNIQDKLAYLFDGFKLLPAISEEERAKFTFLAQPREGDSFEKIKNTISSLKSGLEILDAKAVKNGHQFFIGENRVNLYYVGKKDNFEFFYDISSYGINSILGKVTKSFGLKLTQSGLFYEEKLGIDNHQSKVGDFLVTNDIKKLFNLLKLDHDKFKSGFSNKDEMFAFLSTCPYLNPKKFVEPNKEHKLSIYQDFQAYLINNPISSEVEKISFDDIDNFFEDIDFIAEVNKLKEKESRKREAVQKFSGRTILDYYPDFDKKKIGTSMGYFKFSFGDVEEFRDFLLDNEIDVVMNKFKEVVKF